MSQFQKQDYLLFLSFTPETSTYVEIKRIHDILTGCLESEKYNIHNNKIHWQTVIVDEHSILISCHCLNFKWFTSKCHGTQSKLKFFFFKYPVLQIFVRILLSSLIFTASACKVKVSLMWSNLQDASLVWSSSKMSPVSLAKFSGTRQ